MEKINIHGFPLLTDEECHKKLFNPNASWNDSYFMKPIYKWLPDVGDYEDDEKENYIFKNVEPNKYLVGLKIISNDWVNLGFCGDLLNSFGLVLADANPVLRIGNSTQQNVMMLLHFRHIAFSHSLIISVKK